MVQSRVGRRFTLWYRIRFAVVSFAWYGTGLVVSLAWYGTGLVVSLAWYRAGLAVVSLSGAE